MKMAKRKYDNGLNWYGWTTPFSGYGIVTLEYATALERLGCDVSIGWQRREPSDDLEWKYLTLEQQNLVHFKDFKKEKIGIIKTTPDRFIENISDIRIGYSMVEGTEIGEKWVGHCNAMDAMFVPSKYLVDVFKKCGVTVPIYTVRQGINPDNYHYIERKRNKDNFIFSTCGWLDERKNWREMVTAFTSEFESDEPVELWLKNSNSLFGFEQPSDSRVKFIDELLSFEQMQIFYKNTDCFLFPSRAEGAGMPVREAMATGLPTILTNWSGLADVCDERYNYPLTPVAIDLPDGRKEASQPGFQARISIPELMYWMRHVYENQEEAREKGRKASEWMTTEWSWDVCAKEVIDILKKDFGYK